MKHVALCLTLLASACGVDRAEGAAPPKSYLGLKEKKLSRADAVKLALKVVGRRSEAEVSKRLIDVNVAYWNLYAAQWALRTRDDGLKLAAQAHETTNAKYLAGRATSANYYQSQGQYQLFRAQRLQTLGQVVEKEGELRELLGLRFNDGTRLMPSDTPTVASQQPDWMTSLKEALDSHPDLMLPRVRVLTRWVALQNDRVNRAMLGLPVFITEEERRDRWKDFFWRIPASELNRPWPGREAEQRFGQALENLKDQELKVASRLGNYYRRISLNYDQIQANRAQREAFGEQLKARQQEFEAGRGTLDILLEAQRFYSDARSQEHQSIAAYNSALAGFDYTRGAMR